MGAKGRPVEDAREALEVRCLFGAKPFAVSWDEVAKYAAAFHERKAFGAGRGGAVDAAVQGLEAALRGGQVHRKLSRLAHGPLQVAREQQRTLERKRDKRVAERVELRDGSEGGNRHENGADGV